jgi:transposase
VKQALLACRAVRRVASVPRGVSLQASLIHGVTSGRSCRCRRRLGLLPPPSSRRLRELGRRVYDLTAPINDVDKHPIRLFSAVAPNTLPLPQAGPVSAAQLLITAGGNIDRFPNEAVFGGLCGVAPLRASSGKSHRMRLHHRGNRQTNRGTKLPSAVSYASSPASFIRR